jgi:hypothetical protein
MKEKGERLATYRIRSKMTFMVLKAAKGVPEKSRMVLKNESHLFLRKISFFMNHIFSASSLILS